MIDKLKKKVESTFGQKIRNRGDCERLSEMIFDVTKQQLSYNTLRRFFGLASSTKPRLFTLNVLSVFIGYQSYQDFSKRVNSIDDWREWEVVYDYLDNGNFEEVISLLGTQLIKEVSFNNILITISRELIIRGRYDDFNTIMNQDWMMFSKREYNHVIRFGNAVGSLLRFEDVPQNTLMEFLSSPNYIDGVYKIFVDYSSLTATYGYQVDCVYENLNKYNSETKLFTVAMKYWKDCLLNGYQYANRQSYPRIKTPKDIHPILSGRLMIKEYLVHKGNEIQSRRILLDFKKQIKTLPPQISEFLYEPMNVTLYFNDFVLFDYIHEIINEQDVELNYWYQQYHHTIFRLILVIRYIHHGEIGLAKNLFNSIETNSFRGSYRKFHSVFYYIVEYHLSNSKTKKQSVLQTYRRLTEMIKIPMFTEDYILHYFSPSFRSPYLV